MLSYLFYFFLAYLLYQLVFKFIIPIYRTTKKVKRGFKEMQERMQQTASPGRAPGTHSKEPPKNEVAGEYIDFEEVK